MLVVESVASRAQQGVQASQAAVNWSSPPLSLVQVSVGQVAGWAAQASQPLPSSFPPLLQRSAPPPSS